MNDELKQLIEDAAKLLGLTPITLLLSGVVLCSDGSAVGVKFNPCDPERGDLMKVAEAADLVIGNGAVYSDGPTQFYAKGDYQSLALAVLRAASAVYRAKRGV